MKRASLKDENKTVSRTQKARLEKDAISLLSLPFEIREHVMMQMDPIDMYALYSGVDNESFKRWCDYYFWDYALATKFPDVIVPQKMTHPRWRFFAYVIVDKAFTKHGNEYFENPRYNDDDIVQFDVSDYCQWVSIFFTNTRVDVGNFIFQWYIQTHKIMPTIETFDEESRIQFEHNHMESSRNREFLTTFVYFLFKNGYKYRVERQFVRQFLLGSVCKK